MTRKPLCVVEGKDVYQDSLLYDTGTGYPFIVCADAGEGFCNYGKMLYGFLHIRGSASDRTLCRISPELLTWVEPEKTA